MDTDRYTHEIEVKIMCMVGDAPEFNIEEIEMDLKEYICLDCENKFKGLGKNVICPACKSRNIEMVCAGK